DHHNDYVTFEPRNNSSSGVTLTVGVYPVMNFPTVEEDSKEMFNEIVIEGSEKLVQRTEWFSGDGSTSSFTLSKTPRSMQVWSGSSNFKTTLPTDTDLQNGGVENVTEDLDYTFSVAEKKVYFQSGSIPSSGTYNIMVQYMYPEPTPVLLRDEDSISTYGPLGEDGNHVAFTRNFKLDFVESVTDAEFRGLNLLNEFSKPRLNVKNIKVHNDIVANPSVVNLGVNKTVTFITSIGARSRSEELTIRKISYRYPEEYDILDVGDRELSPVDVLERALDRIHKLEQRDSSTDGVLLKPKIMDNIVTVQPYVTMLRANKEADTLYFDDPEQGFLADDAETVGNDFGDDTDEIFSVAFRVHLVGNIYYEDFFDDDLVDTVGTNATIDTSAHTLSFSSDDVFQSGIVHKDGSDVNSLFWSLQNVVYSGLSNLTFYASAKGNFVYPWNDSLNAKLYAGYHLENDSTDVLGLYDGTASNVTYGNGYYGQSGIFNGSTSKIELPFAPDDFGSTICLCAWVKGDDTPTSNEGIIDADVVSDNGTALIRDSSRKFRMMVTTTGGRVTATSTTQSTNGVWYHVLGTYDGANAKIYVNGVLEATEAVTGDQTGSIDFMIGRGRWDASANRYFDGLIDEAYVFDTLPSDDEIVRLAKGYFEEITLSSSNVFENYGDEGVILRIESSGTAYLDFSHPDFGKSNPWKVIFNG
ncbi:MAG: hypothetical protein KDH96_08920, partial [Candidatus Riesia sp.]|nr:hypothetical protein [Candidatus Riesia sp.]